MLEHHDQSSWRRRGLGYTSTSHFILRGSQDRSSTGTGARRCDWYRGHVCSSCLPQPKDVTTLYRLDSPQLITEKVPHRLADSQILGRRFLKWGSLLLDDFSSCQVGKTVQHTTFFFSSREKWFVVSELKMDRCLFTVLLRTPHYTHKTFPEIAHFSVRSLISGPHH